MDHKSARACFMEYHDGDLAEGDRLALEEHLATCADCTAEWDAYRRAIEEVSGLQVISPSENFAREVALAIELRGKRRFGGLSLVGIRVAVLSLILIMLLLMAYLTYLLLFTAPDPSKAPFNPATKHTHGDVEVIGPIHLEPPSKTDEKK
jgi:anti-sigma factor RsiW